MNASTPSSKGHGPRDVPFSMSVERRPDAAIVCLCGSCTMEVASTVGERLVSQITPTTRLLVVDISKLDFLESAGLGGLVAGYLRIRRNRGDLRLVQPQSAIMALLEMTRLTQLFRVCDSVEEALRLPIT